MSSLKSRFTKATIFLLIVFSLLLAWLLDRVFHHTLIASEEARLKGLVYTVISAMDVSDDGQVTVESSTMIDQLPEEEAVYILDQNKKEIWNNRGKLNEVFLQNLPDTGQWLFEHSRKNNHAMLLKFGFSWESEKIDKEWKYSVVVMDSGNHYRSEMSIFRNTLWTWLTIGSLILLFLQLMLVRWGFSPLGRIASEVAMIEQGQKHKFENVYPSELSQLTSNINSLLRHERSQQVRYQQALDNLAHALKTPLTAIKNLTMQTPNQQLLKDLDEQVLRAKDIVDYQLRKAATVGKTPFAKPVALKEVVEKISRSIQKVYAEKNIQIDIQIPPSITVQIDEGDLFEVVGNILENAAKYCDSKIRITTSYHDHVDLSIEDNGPGFKDQQIQSLTQRGVRQDQRTEGSGIGLSVVYEIISVSGGNLELSRSALLGGALVKIHFS